ncbi:TPA: DUF551 domain-containing protein [Klebsiella quasipneumoniae subsp. similipneumoniae]|uniref:DUF551 domain-containing protein n=1 Tax=Klebsiella quasipneumoniae TaxID=1463165 RepID=UPI0015A73A97|nr:DUF551 domain-containing protein [Klebsiella quasipneumoniae]HDH1361910.1 DUF551 domain-containing protein [Klebsiella quasipneumoniae subsp. similipneumoniae]
MTKSTITRERLEKIKSWRETYGSGSNVMLPAEEAEALALIALAAMDSEPHTDDELSNLLWYSQEAACHSDPNYYCEFQRLATPGLISGIIRELQERRKADSEPVAWTDEQELRDVDRGGCGYLFTVNPVTPHADERRIILLYRHAQPAPVVPDFGTVLESLDHDVRCNIRESEHVYQASKATYDACRDAMPAAAECSIPMISDRWIPVSERMPETDGNYWGWWSESKRQGPVWFIKSELQAQFQSSEITHWMPLPAAPQEVR